MKTQRRGIGRAGLATFATLIFAIVRCGPGAEEFGRTSSEAVPAGFTDAVIVAGLTSPTAFALAPDGRLFVCEQGGALRVVQNGALLAAPFVQIAVDSAGERGLLGVALDPSFSTNGFIYLYYTSTTPAAHNRVSRFTANGNTAVAGSELVLVDLDNLTAALNHNGGSIHFGLDGKLYIGVGDNTVSANAQSMTSRLGKLLRINADGTIPTDNPFFTTATGANRAIWALGLRNPYTFAVQPGTGRIFIDDVGNMTWEEIDDGIAGSNYGWPTTEGPTTDPRFRGPVFSYGHGTGPTMGCAIVGGTFYNPPTAQFGAAYVGKYFFSDLCSGWVRTVDPANNFAAADFMSGQPNTVDLLVHSDGSLYLLDHTFGTVHRITSTAGQAPTITSQPASLTVSVGGSATFSCSADGTAPISYRWQRNNANITGAVSASYTLTNVQLSDSGATFRCVATNTIGSATSNAATLTVTNDTPPTVTITSPAVGSTYAGGDVLSFAATASDTQDGTLPASAFTWWIDFHHDTHLHPAMPLTSGITSGTYAIPNRGETSTNVWYRVNVRVRDSAGLTTETFVDVLPRTVTLSLATSPTGLQVTLDGQPQTAPYAVTGVVGMIRSIGVVSPQTLGSASYLFTSWSDGGAATHEITTAAISTTYTATFSTTAHVGLRGSYYDDQAFTQLIAQRTDPTVNFNWGTGSPISGVQPDTFSVRWTGFVTAPTTGTYTFYLASDEGAILGINGVIVINDFAAHTLHERTATVTLTAGRGTPIRIDYYDATGVAVIGLRWSGPGIGLTVVPSTVLSW